MKTMNYFDIALKVNEYSAKHASTQMGHNMVAVVSLKESKVYAGGRHLIGHVAKATMINHITFPKYDSKVAAKLGMSITPNKPSGMTWDIYPYIKTSDKSGIHYLNVYFAASDVRIEFTTKWLYDGKEATPQEVAEIERWLKPSNSNREISAAMYQIEPVYPWDKIWLGESKAEAKKMFEEVGC